MAKRRASVPAYKVGEQIEVHFDTGWYFLTVKVIAKRHVTVEFVDGRILTVEHDRLRGKRKQALIPSGGIFRVGDHIEALFDNRLSSGRIVSLLNSSATVRFFNGKIRVMPLSWI